jgi:hypothetical protein
VVSGPGRGSGDQDGIAAASTDAAFVFSAVAQVLFGTFAAMTMRCQAAGDAETPKAWAAQYIEQGFMRFCLRALRSFAALPSAASAHSFVGLVAGELQIVASPEGCAQLVMGSLAASGGTAVELHALLMRAIETGEAAPMGLNGVQLHVKATNAVAVLFGGEEKGSGVTLPARVTRVLVNALDQMLEGKSPGNAINQAEALLAVSRSDANTKDMADCGMLDTITGTLVRGQEDLARPARGSYGKYNIKGAREVRGGAHTLGRPRLRLIPASEGRMERVEGGTHCVRGILGTFTPP